MQSRTPVTRKQRNLKTTSGLLALLIVASPVWSRSRLDPIYPYRVGGACPFECCRFGDWIALEPIKISAKERDRRHFLGAVPAGSHFRAVNGALWSITPFVIRTGKATSEHVAKNLVVDTPNRAHIDPTAVNDIYTRVVEIPSGQDIHIVADLGEGQVLGLWNQTPLWLEDVIGIPDERPVDIRETEWWVEVRYGKKHGWIHALPNQIDASDACR